MPSGSPSPLGPGEDQAIDTVSHAAHGRTCPLHPGTLAPRITLLPGSHKPTFLPRALGAPHVATMCTYYYLHYHHVSPCTREIDYTLQYDYCENSTMVRPAPSSAGHTRSSRSARAYSNQTQSTSSQMGPASSLSSSSAPASTSARSMALSSQAHQQHHAAQGSAAENVRIPCLVVTPATDFGLADGGCVMDYANPCATGGCLVSAGCSSGSCRLEDLGGRWVCCRCCRGGNTFRWCAHPMRKVPDTMCYHTVCGECWADEG